MLGSKWSKWTRKDFPSSSFVVAFYGRDHFDMWLFLTVFMLFLCRPDIIDPAIMRPGRLDQLIYIPLPDEPVSQLLMHIIINWLCQLYTLMIALLKSNVHSMCMSLLQAKLNQYTSVRLSVTRLGKMCCDSVLLLVQFSVNILCT